MLLAKTERQALASQQQLVTARMAGAEVEAEWPSMAAAQAELDAVLLAEPNGSGGPDRELLEFLGVA